MGGSLSQQNSDFRTEIIEEFVRCVVDHPDDPTINVRQLLEGSRRISQAYSLNYVPLLFLLDEDHDGRFSLPDIFNISAFELEIDYQEPAKALRAHAALALRRDSSQFVQWFGKLAGAIDGTEQENAVLTVPESATLTLYDLLQVQITRLTPGEFIENLRIYAKQMGFAETRGVPVIVLQSLAQYMLNGFIELYRETLKEDIAIAFARMFTFESLQDEFYEQLGRYIEDEDGSVDNAEG